MVGIRSRRASDRCAHARGPFGERVTERYDESAAFMFEPAVVDPAVDVLADLVGY